MTSRKEMGICERCGTKYPKCRFNKHHQKYCTDPRCVVERRRERQRQRYRKLYADDQGFAESERERRRSSIRKRREDARQTVGEKVPDRDACQISLELFAAGLVSQWIDSNDLEEVKKELGDLMLHLVFYSKIASETGGILCSRVDQGTSTHSLLRGTCPASR